MLLMTKYKTIKIRTVLFIIDFQQYFLKFVQGIFLKVFICFLPYK